MLRNLRLTQRGASYQFSPETISSFPSPLMSATAQASLAPRSSSCFRNGTSSGRPTEVPFRKHKLDLGANEACAEVELVLPKRNFVGTSDRPGDGRSQAQRRQYKI